MIEYATRKPNYRAEADSGTARLTTDVRRITNDILLMALFCGVGISFFFRGFAARGWGAALLVFVSGASWVLTYIGDAPDVSSAPMYVIFLLLAPISLLFSFRAMRAAPDRVAANAAFVGAHIVGILLVFTLGGVVASFL